MVYHKIERIKATPTSRHVETESIKGEVFNCLFGCQRVNVTHANCKSLGILFLAMKMFICLWDLRGRLADYKNKLLKTSKHISVDTWCNSHLEGKKVYEDQNIFITGGKVHATRKPNTLSVAHVTNITENIEFLKKSLPSLHKFESALTEVAQHVHHGIYEKVKDIDIVRNFKDMPADYHPVPRRRAYSCVYNFVNHDDVGFQFALARIDHCSTTLREFIAFCAPIHKRHALLEADKFGDKLVLSDLYNVQLNIHLAEKYRFMGGLRRLQSNMPGWAHDIEHELDKWDGFPQNVKRAIISAVSA